MHEIMHRWGPEGDCRGEAGTQLALQVGGGTPLPAQDPDLSH